MHLLEGTFVTVFYGHNGAVASEMASKLLGIYTSGKRFLVGMNCILEDALLYAIVASQGSFFFPLGANTLHRY
ncbi:hypothetical protein QN277_025518 [Acacia crassicarpa]|uniref:Uncharacterized protein n=1 Tax=Acacia crassicarpa TaxID=499986 RepID=A0AAE1J5R6_9FABA|nr:hypothetical protein QN277_025518 [Acacia crassicarpa]